MALALAILIYIATGVNTDIFIWIKDYAQSLKEDDSAVAQKVHNPADNPSGFAVSSFWL